MERDLGLVGMMVDGDKSCKAGLRNVEYRGEAADREWRSSIGSCGAYLTEGLMPDCLLKAPPTFRMFQPIPLHILGTSQMTRCESRKPKD